MSVVRTEQASSLEDQNYIDLLRQIQGNNILEETEDFYRQFESKINKIYVVKRNAKPKHIYYGSNGEQLKFKAQKWKTIAGGTIEKRTVDPTGNPYHYWEFKLGNTYLIHYMIKKPQAQSVLDETPNNTNADNEYSFDAEMAETYAITGEDSDNYSGPSMPNNNNDMAPNSTFEPAEDFFTYQPWAMYNPFSDTLTLNCNLTIANGYALTHSHADYAEWLRRNDPLEVIQPGDVVGIISSEKGITKVVSPEYVAGVISSRHAICANLPGPEIRSQGEPVAFKGQVPIKVIGDVKTNDIIVPSGRNDGTGIAKRNCKNPELRNHVVGHAWERSDDAGVKLINCLIDIKSPNTEFKVESPNASERRFELQELIMHSLANQESCNTFIDLHLVNQTAILAELKDLVRKLLTLSGLTIIIWVDKSALHGFIKSQFLRDFGEPDGLSGGVIVEEKESLVLVEEWNRDVSFPDYKPIDFDQGVKRVTGVAQALLATWKQAKLDSIDNHTVIISVDIPPKIIMEAKGSLKNASLINLMTKYPITRGFTSTEKVQLYQVNADSLPKVDELHFTREELWAQSAIPHKNVPKGITRGVLKLGGWEMTPFNLPKLKDQISVEHLDCKAKKLQNALISPQETSLIIVGGTSSKSRLNEHAYKIVQDSSGRVHSFTEVKSNFIRSDGIVFKLSPTSVAVLYRNGSNFDFYVVQLEESFSLKYKGQLRVDGVPVSVVWHEQYYYIATKSGDHITIYKASDNLTTCQKLTSLQRRSEEAIQLLPHSPMKIQVGKDLYSMTNTGLVKHENVILGTIVNVSESSILTIRLNEGKMTLVDINMTNFTEETIGELLEILPRTNFSCCKIKENQYVLYGGMAVKSGETLNDVFIISAQPSDYLATYMNIWAAKYKIFSAKKKRRLLAYQQAAEQARSDNDLIAAEKLYEGLSKECPCFDYHFNYAETLLGAKNDNEISQFRAKIEASLQQASKYVQCLNQQMKIDQTKKTLDGRSKQIELSSAMNALSISTATQSITNRTTKDLQSRFESAIANLNQMEAIACIKEGVPVDDRFKDQLSKPSHSLFVQSIAQLCCDTKVCQDWAIWLVQNFSELLKESSLLRRAILSDQRNLVRQLLQSNLTSDINDTSLVSKDDQSIAELAAIKNFPEVLRFCYNRPNFPLSVVIRAICKYANEEAFNELLTFNVAFDHREAIQKCILNLSTGDAEKRMRLIGQILNLVKSTDQVKADEIICWTLKRCNYSWLNDIIVKLRDSVLGATVNESIKPLLRFLEEISPWDEDDVEPTLQLLVRPEHVEKSVDKILDATFKSFNNCENEVLVVKVLQTLSEMLPNEDMINHQQRNLLDFLLDEGIVDDEHIGYFFKSLVTVGFSQWKMTDQNRHQIFDRFKRIANKATHEVVKNSFSNMPSKLMLVLLLETEREQTLSLANIKLIESCIAHGTWSPFDEAERKQLLLFAQRRKHSAILDILTRK